MSEPQVPGDGPPRHDLPKAMDGSAPTFVITIVEAQDSSDWTERRAPGVRAPRPPVAFRTKRRSR